MNVDRIFQTLNDYQVDYLLIGGMNFLLRHAPILTYDVDLWIDDTAENRGRCERALAALDAQWGRKDDDWGPVGGKPAGWLSSQAVCCLTSPHGAIDIFRHVRGLESWADCRQRARREQTATGVAYFGLADEDMLRCQLALEEGEQKQERISALKKALSKGAGDDQ